MSSSGNIKYDAGTRGDKNWILQESAFDRSRLQKIESAFCQGNSYLGQRAALQKKYTIEKAYTCPACSTASERRK